MRLVHSQLFLELRTPGLNRLSLYFYFKLFFVSLLFEILYQQSTNAVYAKNLYGNDRRM